MCSKCFLICILSAKFSQIHFASFSLLLIVLSPITAVHGRDRSFVAHFRRQVLSSGSFPIVLIPFEHIDRGVCLLPHVPQTVSSGPLETHPPGVLHWNTSIEGCGSTQQLCSVLSGKSNSPNLNQRFISSQVLLVNQPPCLEPQSVPASGIWRALDGPRSREVHSSSTYRSRGVLWERIDNYRSHNTDGPSRCRHSCSITVPMTA